MFDLTFTSQQSNSSIEFKNCPLMKNNREVIVALSECHGGNLVDNTITFHSDAEMFSFSENLFLICKIFSKQILK